MNNFELLPENDNDDVTVWCYSSVCNRFWGGYDGDNEHPSAVFCRSKEDIIRFTNYKFIFKTCPLVNKIFLDGDGNLQPCPFRKYPITTVNQLSTNHPYSNKSVEMIKAECQRNGFLPDIVPEVQIRLRPKKSF